MFEHSVSLQHDVTFLRNRFPTFRRDIMPCLQGLRELLSRCSDSVLAGRYVNRIPVWTRFSAPVQTGPGVHPASYTMRTGFFPRDEAAVAWCGVNPPPPSSAEVKERMEVYIYSPYGHSSPALGRVLSLFYQRLRRRQYVPSKCREPNTSRRDIMSQ